MNIYLLASNEFSMTTLNKIYTGLGAFNGPLIFRAPQLDGFEGEDEEDNIELNADPAKLLPVSWHTLFQEITEMRTQFNIEENDRAILLTDRPNENNWFSSFDDSSPLNCFIHTGGWEEYINCDRIFPISYEIVAFPVIQTILGNNSEIPGKTHRVPKGCVMDFCETKSEVMLKLRTADICRDCMNLLTEKQFDTVVLEQIFSILEGLRIKMLFYMNFSRGNKLSKIKVRLHHDIFFCDYGRITLHLSRLEKTLYLFFLNHPEGCGFANLQDHKIEILHLYSQTTNFGDSKIIHDHVKRLIDPRDGSAIQKISRIKRKISNILGDSLATHYVINNDDGIYKINLDRNMVEYE